MGITSVIAVEQKATPVVTEVLSTDCAVCDHVKSMRLSCVSSPAVTLACLCESTNTKTSSAPTPSTRKMVRMCSCTK